MTNKGYSSPMTPAYKPPKLGGNSKLGIHFQTSPSPDICQDNVHKVSKGKKVPMNSPLKNTYRTLPST